MLKNKTKRCEPYFKNSIFELFFTSKRRFPQANALHVSRNSARNTHPLPRLNLHCRSMHGWWKVALPVTCSIACVWKTNVTLNSIHFQNKHYTEINENGLLNRKRSWASKALAKKKVSFMTIDISYKKFYTYVWIWW